ncbi:uncharacterized protein LOC113295592 [Papaver somniferum]|uniref:uncharacterized protein LOC113295592 n=1 Tax=Papaver somniferum TaxID=3469 RepID=UPI000E70079A|nr:uncharacterized protein LOC113295592 [Papaver somniferum]
MMCNGQFLNKSPDDAWSYFDSLAENSQNWDTSGTADRNKSKPLASSRPGMYVLSEEDDLNAKIASLHRKVDAIQNQMEKGTFPAQTQPNPKGQFEVKNSNLEQANVVTTLRSGKVIETPMKVNEPEKSPKLKSSHSDIQNEQSEIDKKTHVPFPHRLLSTKQLADNKDILDVFQQVKINIPLLSVIKQVPAYAKFLKDLCTVKRKHNVQKKAFLTEQVSSILKHNTPPKYKDPVCHTISCIIGKFEIKQELMDLGASVNLLPFSVYQQLGLGELKPTPVTLKLADISV